MTNDEYAAMLSRDRKAIHHELSKHTFQYFGSLASKDIPAYSPVPNIRPVRTVWQAQDIMTTHMPHLLRQLAKINQGPISYWFTIEHGYARERPHVHALFGGMARVPGDTIKNIWENMNGGSAVVEMFDPLRDTGYVYKQIVGQHSSGSGVTHEVLWDTNIWKKGRTHNTPEQAEMFNRLHRAG
jgi:hypothetical protein